MDHTERISLWDDCWTATLSFVIVVTLKDTYHKISESVSFPEYFFDKNLALSLSSMKSWKIWKKSDAIRPRHGISKKVDGASILANKT